MQEQEVCLAMKEKAAGWIRAGIMYTIMGIFALLGILGAAMTIALNSVMIGARLCTDAILRVIATMNASETTIGMLDLLIFYTLTLFVLFCQVYVARKSTASG